MWQSSLTFHTPSLYAYRSRPLIADETQVGLQRLSDSEGELRRMAIDPTMRKKGLGSKLVRVIEEHAAAIGLSRLVLTTGSIMAPAVSLYERCGWESCRYG